MRPPGATARRRSAPEGNVEVFVADEQDAQPVDVARWSRLAEQVLRAEGVRGESELSVLFVAESAIAELNQRFLGGSGSTDVLAFPLEEDLLEVGNRPDPATTGPDRDLFDPAEAPLLLGDVVICPAVAAVNAPDHSGTYEDEIALLVVHGILHVLGHDHGEDDDRGRMQARERELVMRFHGELAADPWAVQP